MDHNGLRIEFRFLLLLLLAGLVLALWIAKPFLQPLGFAIVLALGFYAMHKRVVRRIRYPSLAATASTLIVLIAVLIPLVLIASLAGQQLIHAAQFVGNRSAAEGGFVAWAMSLLEKPLDWLNLHFGVDRSDLRNQLGNLPASLSEILLATGTSFLGSFAGLAVNTVLTFFTLFFLFRDGASFVNRIATVLPLRRERAHTLLRRIYDSVIANLYGIIAVGAAQGILTGIALLITGVPSALLLGLAAAFASVIPFVGSALVWVPAGVYLLITHHIWQGLFILGWGAALISTVDNILRPLVIAGKVPLHPLVLLIALIGGVSAFGFLGLFIGPAIVSVVLTVLDMLREDGLAAQS